MMSKMGLDQPLSVLGATLADANLRQHLPSLRRWQAPPVLISAGHLEGVTMHLRMPPHAQYGPAHAGTQDAPLARYGMIRIDRLDNLIRHPPVATTTAILMKSTRVKQQIKEISFHDI
jgi:hypothetical protein